MRSPPSTGSEECFVNCSGELNPMISPTESSRVAACWSMGLPHLIVALGAPGRAAPEESGSEPAAELVTGRQACVRSNQGEAGLSCGVRRTRGRSQGACRSPGARGACQDLRGVVRTNSGDPASSRSYQDVVTIANPRGGCLSDPSGTLARRLCGPGPFVAVGPG